MPCEDCSNGLNNRQNPLDCGTQSMQCNNPCGVSAGNTAACESLPSQIENFTIQFFGEVIKTEINGKVVWSLPCSLDVGLPGNPRGVDEGLACYFLRLFSDGIGGLRGEKGCQGDAGADGHNSYAVVKQSFSQPTISSPLVQIVIFTNPAILTGMFVFVQGSGYYQVTDVQAGGVVFATLVSAVANPPATINVGALMVPCGPPAP